ncbi:MAG: hypothetical protein JXB48_02375, partial [Candidatus Latescibacteria bacterium]|nr:hypothetical protein [Candidatus Latescibacterota bacterium]
MNKHIIILCFIVFITLFSAVSYGSDYTPVITNYPDFKNISCLAANGDDIWIGTKYSGSYQFNRQTESFVHHEPGGSKIVVDGNGDVWIGINTVSSYKDGIWERHMDSSGFYTVSGLAVDSKGTIWRIYSYTRLEGETSIEYYNGHEWIVKYREYQGIHNRFINLAIDSKDRFWNLYYVWDDDANIPVYKIIGLYENEEIKLMDPGIYGHVTSIIEDNKGAMWFSTNVIVIDKSETEKPIMENNGIWVFDGETWINYTTENSGLISNHINVMVVDKYDRKWFGTDTGLVVYDGRNWITYSTADGLVDNTITALTIDDDDNLWVGTANGLLKISNSTGQVLRLMSPIAGDQVPSGGIFTITWKPAEVEKIKLEYSANGGIHWKNIADNVDVSTESYIWSVPDIISSECQIRISDTDNSQIYDINSDFFSIVFPEITIITPHGGEQWKTNFLCTIEWNYTASDKVNLEYSVDNGINWRPIVSNIDAVDRTYDWIIPEMEYSSTQCFVRVSDMVNPEIYKVNDRLFSIMSIKSNALSFENSGYNYINTLYYPVKSLELWIQFSGSPSDWLIKTTSYYDDTDYYSPSIISNIYVYEGISNEDFTLIKDKWYHVALTGFENKRHIYVNGDLVFEGSLSKNGIPSFNLSIGEKFKGIISELRIWASFINKDQIHENMYKRVDHGEGLTSAFHMTGGNRENIFFDSVGKKHGLLSGNYKW